MCTTICVIGYPTVIATVCRLIQRKFVFVDFSLRTLYGTWRAQLHAVQSQSINPLKRAMGGRGVYFSKYHYVTRNWIHIFGIQPPDSLTRIRSSDVLFLILSTCKSKGKDWLITNEGITRTVRHRSQWNPHKKFSQKYQHYVLFK